MQLAEQQTNPTHQKHARLADIIEQCWEVITPCYPLTDLIAINPLQGFEKHPFDEGMKKASKLFQQPELPESMQQINAHTIKWCQAFFDRGQAAIRLPQRELGFFRAFRKLVFYDKSFKHSPWFLHAQDMPKAPLEMIEFALNELAIPKQMHQRFMTLMLTTLPGWASHVKYYVSEHNAQRNQQYPTSLAEYLAIRLLLTLLLWPSAKQLLTSFLDNSSKTNEVEKMLSQMQHQEKSVQQHYVNLLNQHAEQDDNKQHAKTQWAFCIDPRSEKKRREIEESGQHLTFGCAGFFNLPIAIYDNDKQKNHAKCPALLQPEHVIIKEPIQTKGLLSPFKYLYDQIMKNYYSLKYSLSSPLILAEAHGFFSFLKMLNHLVKRYFASMTIFNREPTVTVCYRDEHLSHDDKVAMVSNFLQTIGLTKNFARFIFITGHQAKTINNAFQSGLDCGACGAHSGSDNAILMAQWLNDNAVRQSLSKQGINIDTSTHVLAVSHQTTSNELQLLTPEFLDEQNRQYLHDQGITIDAHGHITLTTNDKCFSVNRAQQKATVDWSHVRPEWGLANNALFVIAPRAVTQNIELNDRAFLHSYDWQSDNDGSVLTTLLTAPVIVAQWINSQYNFSTIDPVAWGAGSKTTKNISGKFAVMQGNASDLMHGLPWQSVKANPSENFHQPSRLCVWIKAPKQRVHDIISGHEKLLQLCTNEWLHIFCFDPIDKQCYRLTHKMGWQVYRD